MSAQSKAHVIAITKHVCSTNGCHVLRLIYQIQLQTLLMTNTLITSALWTIAIAHCLTDRVLKPFVLSVYAALIEEAGVTPVVPVALAAAPSLVVEPAPEPVIAAVVKTPRPARRRKASAKVPA